MKYLILIFLLTFTNITMASPAKIGDFELKRYSDEKSISKILLSDFDELDESACIGSVVDVEIHQILAATGRYIRAVTLKVTEEDEEHYITAVFEYASVRTKDATVITKSMKCLLSDGNEVKNNDDFNGF